MEFSEIFQSSLREMINKFRDDGHKFVYFNSETKTYNDVTESFYMGSFTPLLIWQMNQRKFEMEEGRHQSMMMDYFKHDLGIPLSIDTKSFTGANCIAANITENNLTVSKAHCLYFLRDSIYSLYNELPSVKFVFNVGNEQEKFINPAVDAFRRWFAIQQYVKTGINLNPQILKDCQLDERLGVEIFKQTVDSLNEFPPDAIQTSLAPLVEKYTKKRERIIQFNESVEKQQAGQGQNLFDYSQYDKPTDSVEENTANNVAQTQSDLPPQPKQGDSKAQPNIEDDDVFGTTVGGSSGMGRRR